MTHLLLQGQKKCSPVRPEVKEAVALFLWCVMLLHPSVGNLRYGVSAPQYLREYGETDQGEVALHGGQESVSILLRTDDGRFAFVRAT